MILTVKLNAGMANLAKNMKTGVDNYKVDGKIVENVELVLLKHKI